MDVHPAPARCRLRECSLNSARLFNVVKSACSQITSTTPDKPKTRLANPSTPFCCMF
ncbi:hypothetical protein RSAG8_02471, partial [Rhizoctonia solani AG-8 WAC10335]